MQNSDVANKFSKLHIGVWLSLVERYVRDVEAAGSNPVTPIHPRFYGGFSFLQREKAGWLWFGLSGACQIFGFGVARLDNLFLFIKF